MAFLPRRDFASGNMMQVGVSAEVGCSCVTSYFNRNATPPPRGSAPYKQHDDGHFLSRKYNPAPSLFPMPQ